MLTFLNGKIQINLADDGGASINTDIDRMVCPSCGCADCVFSCDGSQGADENNGEDEEDVADRVGYNGALDGLESFLMALVASGVINQSEDPRVNEAIQTTLDAFENHICE